MSIAPQLIAEYVSIMPTRAVQRAATAERLAEVVTMRRQLCDEHVTIENQAAHVEDWRGLKGTPSRDKTQQNSAANVGCGSAADQIVRPSAPCSRTRTTVTLDLPSEERWGYNLPT